MFFSFLLPCNDPLSIIQSSSKSRYICRIRASTSMSRHPFHLPGSTLPFCEWFPTFFVTLYRYAVVFRLLKHGSQAFLESLQNTRKWIGIPLCQEGPTAVATLLLLQLHSLLHQATAHRAELAWACWTWRRLESCSTTGPWRSLHLSFPIKFFLPILLWVLLQTHFPHSIFRPSFIGI